MTAPAISTGNGAPSKVTSDKALQSPRHGGHQKGSMFVDRKAGANGVNMLWYCEYERTSEGRSRKRWVQPLGEEQPPIQLNPEQLAEVPAICWSLGRTMGNIAVYSAEVIGSFPDAPAGQDAILPCHFTEAGLFRNGAARSWCTVHQIHWGKKADLLDTLTYGRMRCAHVDQPMWYVKTPPTFEVTGPGQVGLWCELPPALSSRPIERSPPRIYVRSRVPAGEQESTHDAVSLVMPGTVNVFGDRQISRINITPPSAYDFVRCVEQGIKLVTIECKKCHFPHLDLGDFAVRPHSKHTCGNCGWDHTWSKEPIVSNPLQRLHDQFSATTEYAADKGSLDLADYAGLDYEVWASTPALLWDRATPQPVGTRVRIMDGDHVVVNGVFGNVKHNGAALERERLFEAMIRNTII